MSRQNKSLEEKLEEFNIHLRNNEYEPIHWSAMNNDESILMHISNKLVEVSNEMENEVEIMNNPRKLERLEGESEIIECGLSILRHGIDN